MISNAGIIGLLGLIATVNIAQFGHQLWFTREFSTHRALPPKDAHGGSD